MASPIHPELSRRVDWTGLDLGKDAMWPLRQSFRIELCLLIDFVLFEVTSEIKTITPQKAIYH